MKTFAEFKELVDSYRPCFKRCNVTASTLTDLQNNYEITETVTTKHGRKIISVETNQIEAINYAYSITGMFIGERVSKAYTMAGYLATEMRSTSPDRSTTIIRSYTFNPRKEDN